MKLIVVIPLCDYEPITSVVWNRRVTQWIARQSFRSFADNIRTSLYLYILADRCTDKMIGLAKDSLKKFKPVVIDNSKLNYGLEDRDLPYKHVVNQFLKAVDLANDHDILYFCEQDYLFKQNALEHALTAFKEIPQVNVLSMFDHPNLHDPSRNPEFGRHRFFDTSFSRWKSVASLNGNWLWRVPFVKRRYKWLLSQYLDGALDFRITNSLYKEGELMLSPVKSLIQHLRIDGANTSPTFGSSTAISLARGIGYFMKYLGGKRL